MMNTLEGTADKPGLKFCIWPRAFVQAAGKVVDRVFNKEMLNQVYTQSHDDQVTEVVRPTLRIAIQRRELSWMLDNVSVTARGQRRNQYGEENFQRHVFGAVDVNIGVDSSGPFYDPIYSADVDTDNLSFTYASRGNVINLSNTCNGRSTNSINVSNTQTHQSASQTNNRKRPLEDVFINNGSVKRYRNDMPTTISGSNIIIGSVVTNTSSGIRGNSVTSVSGNGISIFGNGSSVISSGGNGASVSISGSGTDDDLGRTLIGALENAVLESLNCRLPDYSFPIGNSSDWMFNFSLLSKPKFQNGCMESIHRAAIHYNGDTVMLPTQTPPFPEPQNSPRMLTIFISNYVFNTVGYCFQQNGILNYNLTQADLIPQTAEDNSAADPPARTRCLSDCFPDFSVKYPDASVEVNMASSEAPTVTFSGQSLKVSLLGSATFRARLADGSLVDFLTTDVNMEITVLLKMTMEKLMGTVTFILPRSITVVRSAVESVNREVLKGAFDLIGTQFLSRKIEEIIQKGIPIPCPFLAGVEEFENVVVQAAGDFLRIDTDLKFHA